MSTLTLTTVRLARVVRATSRGCAILLCASGSLAFSPLATAQSTPAATSAAQDCNAPTARLANLSSFVHVGPAAGAPLTGLVVTGSREKPFLVRGVGPGLRQFGVPDAITDPVLRVLDRTGREIARNTGWSHNAATVQIARAAADLGTFQLPDGSADTALLLWLAPGAYTLIVDSASGQTGVALAEIYELDRIGAVASLSTVATVDAAHPTFFGSFMVRGTAPKKFLIRAVGPGLGAMGVSDALSDPQLMIYNYSCATATARNDDWVKPATSDDADATAIADAATACGAFTLPAGSKDAAVVVTLTPGAYTVIVAGKTDTTGLVLLEVYGVP